jgi:hypothetical protein
MLHWGTTGHAYYTAKSVPELPKPVRSGAGSLNHLVRHGVQASRLMRVQRRRGGQVKMKSRDSAVARTVFRSIKYLRLLRLFLLLIMRQIYSRGIDHDRREEI